MKDIPKVQAFDGSSVPAWIELPCGNRAHWDRTSECAYRCYSCFAVVGSAGMPRDCYEMLNVQPKAD